MNKRPDGRWQKAVTINGKRKFFYSYANTEKQAEKDIEAQMLSFNIKLHKEKHNFKELAEQMLDDKTRDISETTLACYKYALKRADKLWEYDIEQITPKMIQTLLKEMAQKKYSQSAIQKTKVIIGLVIDYAIIQGVDINNFMPSVKSPRTPRARVSAPEDKVIAKIKNASQCEFGDFAAMLLYTGMRRGELVALQRKDVDLNNGIIHITKSVEYIVNTPHLKDMPKTQNSIRDIPILNDLKPIITKLCKGIAPDDFLFGGKKPYTVTMVNKRWRKYAALIGYPDLHMHQLRHAYAWILFRSGVAAKTAQGLLGHADIKTTMNIYTDFSDDVVTKSMANVNAYLLENFQV